MADVVINKKDIKDVKKFGIVLQKLRISSGMSQDTVAAKMKKQQAFISKLEVGYTFPSFKTFVTQVDAMGYDIIIRPRE